MPLDRSALSDLGGRLQGPVLTEPETLGRFSHDASFLVGDPAGVASPSDREEVVEIVRWARRWKVPLVARGGGTSLDGESVPPPGALVVDFSGWNALLEVDLPNRIARVGPGLINRELQRSLAREGLFFPPNPGSWNESTLGGNVATNASGPRSFRYGPTRSWVRGLEVVLGSGEILRLGHRARRSSTGPDLLGFLVGSEGTLGLFTEITLGLAPVPERRIGVVLALPSELDLGRLLVRLTTSPAPNLAAVEYIDERAAGALAQEGARGLPPGSSVLLLELETTVATEEQDALRLLERVRSAGVREDPSVYPNADELWTLRGRSGSALDRWWPRRVREDVAVPWSRIDELLAEVRALARRSGVELSVYGHLGDGALHPQFLLDPASPEGQSLRSELLVTAHRLGGTISAEHGIGSVKAPHLGLEHGRDGVELLRELRRSFDPDGILNPGKLLPPAEGAAATRGERST